jgi:hypothetical protein
VKFKNSNLFLEKKMSKTNYSPVADDIVTNNAHKSNKETEYTSVFKLVILKI